MFATAGASREHNLIAMNLGTALNTQLRDTDCEVHPAHMRVKVSPTGLYTYPDVTVVCHQPRFEDEQFDTLLNPLVIVEVLSKSTEAYDRGAKFEQYRRIGSLREYLLVAQDWIHIEHFARQDDGNWLLREYSELATKVELASISCEVLLEDVYRKLSFDDKDEPV